jgi:hypothetical protein
MPLTMKMIESAASTLNFGLSNAAWLQTISLFSIPTAATTFGFFASGWMGAISGLIIGLVLMMPLAMLLYRVNVMTAVQAVVLGAMLYVPALVGNAAIMYGVATLIVPMWHLRLPWGEAPVQVATTDQPAATENKPAPTPTPTPVAPTETAPKPVVAEKPETIVAPQPPKLEWQGGGAAQPRW